MPDAHRPLGQRATPRDALDLDDDGRAEPTGGLGAGQHLAGDRLLLHRHVALLVGGRAAQDHDVERERLEAQPVLAVDAQELDDLLARRLVLSAAELARIDECVEARPGDQARSTGRDLSDQLRDHPLGDGIGLEASSSAIGMSGGESIRALVNERLSIPDGGSARRP